MKLMRFLKNKVWKAYVILPAITLFCFAGFIASLLFPNTVLDTYVINMSEEEGDTETLVPLSLGADHAVVYYLDTAGRSMQGIQVGICKNGKAFVNTTLVYVVSSQETDAVLSENRYSIAEGQDLQYVYLPYANSEACSGKIKIAFFLEGDATDEAMSPCLVTNHAQVKDTKLLGSNEDTLTLKCSYIYSHDTYPFLYDFRIMSFVFLAVSMAVSYPKLKNKKTKKIGGMKSETE